MTRRLQEGSNIMRSVSRFRHCTTSSHAVVDSDSGKHFCQNVHRILTTQSIG
jgi:hypothetical protein